MSALAVLVRLLVLVVALALFWIEVVCDRRRVARVRSERASAATQDRERTGG